MIDPDVQVLYSSHLKCNFYSLIMVLPGYLLFNVIVSNLARFALRGDDWQKLSGPRRFTFRLETPLLLERHGV